MREVHRKKKSEKHGLSRTNLYITWSRMLDRCYNLRSNSYRFYGAKGVTVCDRWRESFLNFKRDMGEKPSKIHSLDRINPYGNYEPSNCRWATPDIQLKNKRSKYKKEYKLVDNPILKRPIKTISKSYIIEILEEVVVCLSINTEPIYHEIPMDFSKMAADICTVKDFYLKRLKEIKEKRLLHRN